VFQSLSPQHRICNGRGRYTQNAAKIIRETFDYVLANIKVGMTEQQVVGLALGKMYELVRRAERADRGGL
jgi:hypothetical protein